MTASRPTPSPFMLAALLSLAAAISLGITRFAYGLLLPIMREDLGWSYTLAGAMNTANAMGYLLGALSAPTLMRHWGTARALLVGAVGASVFMAMSGFVRAADALLVQRLLAGVASAWVFIAGGLLVAQLAARHPQRSGWLLGLYYGGTGWGIAVSALAVPAIVAWSGHWAGAWWALALICGLATALLLRPVRQLHGASTSPTATASDPALVRPLAYAPMLAGYGCFGVGYIGYMTFVIAMLREQGVGTAGWTSFYLCLGLAVVASARIWAGLLDRCREGQALALLNALLGLAALVPAVTALPWALLLSGLLFGSVFLSVVASTTAWVRHNLPAAQWAKGITVFTVVFALGQIIGPTWVGAIADGPGGLARGLVVSACVLWLGSALAMLQKPLATPRTEGPT
jgi:predicted MFS family arabinose efflux permease